MFVLSFLARRLAQGAVIIFLVSLLIFTLLRVMSGNPVRQMVGGMAPDSPGGADRHHDGPARSDHRAVRPLRGRGGPG
ncbi:protein of unknown function [Methylorubrum extorquens]|uniref:Uncharacterized protein n=1 Tax=Methylorubrum extorquens TaxID=408 RepID=A0A2N9AM68_METEX|nr:protein of unknown function [Methylorubrum extorquens]